MFCVCQEALDRALEDLVRELREGRAGLGVVQRGVRQAVRLALSSGIYGNVWRPREQQVPCEAGVGYGGVGTGGGGVHQQMKPKIGHQEVKSLHLAGDGAPMEDFTKKGNLVGVLGFSLGRVTLGLKERQVEAELGEPRGSLGE